MHIKTYVRIMTGVSLWPLILMGLEPFPVPELLISTSGISNSLKIFTISNLGFLQTYEFHINLPTLKSEQLLQMNILF